MPFSSRLSLLAEKKEAKKKKRLFIKSDLISSMYVYSRFTIKDCSSSQFSGSRLQSQHITIFQHITIHRQQKNVGSRGHKNEQGYSRRDSACQKRRLRLTKKSLQLNNQMQ